jgi:hypothetical protein
MKVAFDRYCLGYGSNFKDRYYVRIENDYLYYNDSIFDSVRKYFREFDNKVYRETMDIMNFTERVINNV